jgi:hypothetical protein
MTFNFNIFQCFSNIRNHLSNFSYLVCISCKIFIRWRFYLFLKTKSSRRVAESCPVCVGLKKATFLSTRTSDCRGGTAIGQFVVIVNTYDRIECRLRFLTFLFPYKSAMKQNAAKISYTNFRVTSVLTKTSHA